MRVKESRGREREEKDKCKYRNFVNRAFNINAIRKTEETGGETDINADTRLRKSRS